VRALARCLVTGRDYDPAACATTGDAGRIARLLSTPARRRLPPYGRGQGRPRQGSRTWGLDGKRHQSWGFSDLVDCCSKIDGMLAYHGVRSSLDMRPRAGEGGASPRAPRSRTSPTSTARSSARRGVRRRRAARVRAARARHGDTRPSPLPDPHYLDSWIGRRGLEMIEAPPRVGPGSRSSANADPTPHRRDAAHGRALSRTRPCDRHFAQHRLQRHDRPRCTASARATRR
jgi:hypothetical protein